MEIRTIQVILLLVIAAVMALGASYILWVSFNKIEDATRKAVDEQVGEYLAKKHADEYLMPQYYHYGLIE
jgi:uncharacterized protein YpmB